MKETKYVCDHCGKKLDEMKDYIDVGEDIGICSNINGDLCSDCYHKLENIVIGFFQRKEFCEKEDKNKSGLRFELPVKVGDKVYCPVKSVNRVAYGTLDWIDISPKNIVYTVVERSYEGIAHKRPIQYRVGYVFTTKDAAEAKLKELRGEE